MPGVHWGTSDEPIDDDDLGRTVDRDSNFDGDFDIGRQPIGMRDPNLRGRAIDRDATGAIARDSNDITLLDEPRPSSGSVGEYGSRNPKDRL
jgi:hypothetical protein